MGFRRFSFFASLGRSGCLTRTLGRPGMIVQIPKRRFLQGQAVEWTRPERAGHNFARER